MELAAIAPMKVLENWRELAKRPTHMCLAQLALENSKYLEWMRQRVKERKTVILDNGAYEGQLVSAKDLASLAAYLRPTYVVVPDTPNDSIASLEQAASFKEHWEPALQKFGVGLMMIAHCEPESWSALERSLQVAKQNIWAIGLSRLTTDFGRGCGKRRDYALQELWLSSSMFDNWRPYVHMFGFGGLEELEGLIRQPIAPHSIDTSAPIWRGLQGYTLEDNWPDYPFELEPENHWPVINKYIARNNLKDFDAILASNR